MQLRDFLSDVISKMPKPKAKLTAEEDIRADIRPQALERALMNLLSNAQKYAKNSRVSLTQNESNIYIAVEDDGPGIPVEKHGEAFKAFQRLDTARNQNIEGVGLGLSIARDIAQIHGGALRLEDSDMGGLKALIRLPI